MTSKDVKNELTEEFSGIKYILTSGMRSRLLLAIYENPKKLDELRGELHKPSATILHGLKELENINLVRKVQKSYELTSNGFLLTANMIKLIENWYSINKDKSFWNNHDLSGIPDELLKSIYLLKDAEYVNSTTSILQDPQPYRIRLPVHLFPLRAWQALCFLPLRLHSARPLRNRTTPDISPCGRLRLPPTSLKNTAYCIPSLKRKT